MFTIVTTISRQDDVNMIRQIVYNWSKKA